MNRFVQWLLDLDDVFLGKDAPLSLQWELPVPAWVLLAFVLLSAGAIIFVYGRERISRARQIVLIAFRLSIVGVLLAMLSRPTLVLQQNRVEPAFVAVVVDRSLSMGGTDSPGDGAAAMGVDLNRPDVEMEAGSRLDVARQSLLRNDRGALQKLLQHNGIQLVTFATGAEPAALVSRGQSPDLLDAPLKEIVPDGAGTDFSSALQLILNRMHGKRFAAMVLASDGRLTSTGQLDELLERMADRQIPVFPIRLGSTRREVDVEVASVRAQSMVFANDLLLVESTLIGRGLDEPVSCTVQLVDDQSGTVVDEKTVTISPDTDATTVELSVKPPREGDARFRVRVLPLPEEKILENNTEFIETRVLADRLKVLYVEGYPRFEYRFLKNALLRERSIELSVLLLEADENFVQEGTESIRRFPQTKEELARYHVILFGDVDPNEGWLTTSQMNMLVDFVGDKGGGFGLLAGERSAPHRFLGTPLERLIPVNIDPRTTTTSETTIVTGFQAELTASGRESRVLRFLPDPVANEQVIHALPDLFWISRSLGPKPGSAVQLVHPDLNSASGPMPLVVFGRFGAGKLFYQATDDTWRWRRHTGELLYDGYWVRVMRELMNPNLASVDRRYVIRTDRRVYPYGESVRAQVEILDPRLVSDDLSQIGIHVSRNSANSNEPVPESGTVERSVQLERVGNQSELFEGVFLPQGTGNFVISAPELSAGGKPVTASFRIENPDLELRRLDADHHMLMRIAAKTGGKVLEPDALEAGLSEIRDRSVQIPDDITKTLWDTRLVLLIFVLMISMEWGLRKAFGLL